MLTLSIFWQTVSAEEITLYTWDEYISEQVIDEFERLTNHKVTVFIYDDEIARDAILLSAQAQLYDLVLVDNNSVMQYQHKHIFHKLIDQNIAGRTNHNEKWNQACGDYAMPYAKGTIGIAYRKSIIKQGITSWQSVLEPAADIAKNTLMLANDMDTLAISLIAQGFDPFSINTAELKIAFDALKKQKSLIKGFEYAPSYTAEHTTSSEIVVAAIYSGDTEAMKRHTKQDDWTYTVPKEGTIFWVDCYLAPSIKPIKQATLAFLAYLNQPEVAKINAEELWISTTNDQALKLISPQYLADPELMTPDAIINRSHSYQTLTNQQIIQRNRIMATLNRK